MQPCYCPPVYSWHFEVTQLGPFPLRARLCAQSTSQFFPRGVIPIFETVISRTEITSAVASWAPRARFERAHRVLLLASIYLDVCALVLDSTASTNDQKTMEAPAHTNSQPCGSSQLEPAADDFEVDAKTDLLESLEAISYRLFHFGQRALSSKFFVWPDIHVNGVGAVELLLCEERARLAIE